MGCLVRVVKVPADGLALIADGSIREGRRGWRTLWTRRRARKDGECYATGCSYKRGDLVYGPVDDGLNRMRRVLASWVER